MAKFQHTIEVKGHLIDSMILTKIFDIIMDLQGEFQVQKFSVGKKKKDASYAKLLIQGKSKEHLNQILQAVYREGAISKIQQEVVLKITTKDMVMPDDFYSTTNNHTDIFYKGKWIEVENMMMDKCIAVKANRAFCTPIREIKKGDTIVVGEQGIRITPPERPREGVNLFQFMGSGSSSERPTQHIARRVAEDI
ncbi:MAG: TIGR00300 family protein, partial [Thaumarchaeota archaeon]|nr:TIGR00300 family protein [Nitrososphaerota archaeon]